MRFVGLVGVVARYTCLRRFLGFTAVVVVVVVVVGKLGNFSWIFGD